MKNVQNTFNGFLDGAIQGVGDVFSDLFRSNSNDRNSSKHARKLANLKRTVMSKIEFSEQELCDESPYAKKQYQNGFYFWHLSRNNSEHETVCEIFRDVHDGIIHFVHEFGCTGEFYAINRKLKKLVPYFCPDLKAQRKPLGVDF